MWLHLQKILTFFFSNYSKQVKWSTQQYQISSISISHDRLWKQLCEESVHGEMHCCAGWGLHVLIWNNTCSIFSLLTSPAFPQCGKCNAVHPHTSTPTERSRIIDSCLPPGPLRAQTMSPRVRARAHTHVQTLTKTTGLNWREKGDVWMAKKAASAGQNPQPVCWTELLMFEKILFLPCRLRRACSLAHCSYQIEMWLGY